MKRILTFGFLMCSLAFFFMDCSSDPCDDIFCNNGACIDGTCENNICNCEAGFEGEFCDSVVRDRYIGSWSGPNTCDLDLEEAMLPDSIFIVISENADNIAAVDLLLNLDDLGDLPQETAVLIDGTFTVLPAEIIVQGFPVQYEISGRLNENDILDVSTSVNVDVNGIPFPIICEAQLTRN